MAEEVWNAEDWNGCCVRCSHYVGSYARLLPETEDDAICDSCAWTELEDLRRVARRIYEEMAGTCDYGEPACTQLSFAGFLHAPCGAHAEESGTPIAAVEGQTLLAELRAALRIK